jgi:hypothetical protein
VNRVIDKERSGRCAERPDLAGAAISTVVRQGHGEDCCRPRTAVSLKTEGWRWTHEAEARVEADVLSGCTSGLSMVQDTLVEGGCTV